MGLLLSVLITCVGVLEVIACYTHLRFGITYNQYKNDIKDVARNYALELRRNHLHHLFPDGQPEVEYAKKIREIKSRSQSSGRLDGCLDSTRLDGPGCSKTCDDISEIGADLSEHDSIAECIPNDSVLTTEHDQPPEPTERTPTESITRETNNTDTINELKNNNQLITETKQLPTISDISHDILSSLEDQILQQIHEVPVKKSKETDLQKSIPNQKDDILSKLIEGLEDIEKPVFKQEAVKEELRPIDEFCVKKVTYDTTKDRGNAFNILDDKNTLEVQKTGDDRLAELMHLEAQIEIDLPKTESQPIGLAQNKNEITQQNIVDRKKDNIDQSKIEAERNYAPNVVPDFNQIQKQTIEILQTKIEADSTEVPKFKIDPLLSKTDESIKKDQTNVETTSKKELIQQTVRIPNGTVSKHPTEVLEPLIEKKSKPVLEAQQCVEEICTKKFIPETLKTVHVQMPSENRRSFSISTKLDVDDQIETTPDDIEKEFESFLETKKSDDRKVESVRDSKTTELKIDDILELKEVSVPCETKIDEPKHSEPCEIKIDQAKIPEPRDVKIDETKVREFSETKIEEAQISEPSETKIEEPIISQPSETKIEKAEVSEPVETKIEEVKVSEPCGIKTSEMKVPEPCEIKLGETKVPQPCIIKIAETKVSKPCEIKIGEAKIPKSINIKTDEIKTPDHSDLVIKSSEIKINDAKIVEPSESKIPGIPKTGMTDDKPKETLQNIVDSIEQLIDAIEVQTPSTDDMPDLEFVASTEEILKQDIEAKDNLLITEESKVAKGSTEKEPEIILKELPAEKPEESKVVQKELEKTVLEPEIKTDESVSQASGEKPATLIIESKSPEQSLSSKTKEHIEISETKSVPSGDNQEMLIKVKICVDKHEPVEPCEVFDLIKNKAQDTEKEPPSIPSQDIFSFSKYSILDESESISDKLAYVIYPRGKEVIPKKLGMIENLTHSILDASDEILNKLSYVIMPKEKKKDVELAQAQVVDKIEAKTEKEKPDSKKKVAQKEEPAVQKDVVQQEELLIQKSQIVLETQELIPKNQEQKSISKEFEPIPPELVRNEPISEKPKLLIQEPKPVLPEQKPDSQNQSFPQTEIKLPELDTSILPTDISLPSTDITQPPPDLELEQISSLTPDDSQTVPRVPSPYPMSLFGLSSDNGISELVVNEDFLRSLDGVKPNKCDDRRRSFKKKRNSSSSSRTSRDRSLSSVEDATEKLTFDIDLKEEIVLESPSDEMKPFVPVEKVKGKKKGMKSDNKKDGEDVMKILDLKDVDESTKIVDDKTKVVDESTKVVDDNTKISDDVTKISDTKIIDEVPKASENKTKTDDITNISDEKTKTTEEHTKVSDESVKALGEKSKSLDESTKTPDTKVHDSPKAKKIKKSSKKGSKVKNTKSQDDGTKTVDEKTKTSEETTKVSDSTKVCGDDTKVTDDATKKSEEISRPVVDKSKSIEDVSKSADDLKDDDQESSTLSEASQSSVLENRSASDSRQKFIKASVSSFEEATKSQNEELGRELGTNAKDKRSLPPTEAFWVKE